MRFMKDKHDIIIIAILTLSLLTIEAYAQVPYRISVEPAQLTAALGDVIEYSVCINADPGFEESIYIELEVSALTYSEVYFSETVYGPYPMNYDYTFEVPEDAPGGVTVTGIIRGISGDYIIEEEVTIKIRSGGVLEGIIEWFLSILNRILDFFS